MEGNGVNPVFCAKHRVSGQGDLQVVECSAKCIFEIASQRPRSLAALVQDATTPRGRDAAPVYLGDVARVSDSFAVQNNMVHVNGKRAAYLAILKHADASTLAVVDTVSIRLLFIVGTDFFQTVDAGLMKLHLRAPSGTRIEQTEQLVAQVEKRIREVIPTAEIRWKT